MPVSHGIITSSSFVSSSGSLLQADTPIGIIGTSASGSNNVITRVRNATDIVQFGDENVGSLVKAIKILQSYGCNNLYVIKVATGVDASATATNIIGGETSGVKTGLPLFKDVWNLYREKPQLLLIPGFNTDAVLQAALTVAANSSVDALVLSSFTLGTSRATAETIRASSTGLGIKNARLIPCIPYVKNSLDQFEELSIHLAGLIAKTAIDRGFGYTPSNKMLVGVNGTESGFVFSYTDDTSDNQILENLGVVSLNLNSDGYVAWGNRNSLFVDNTNESLDTFIVLNRIKQVLNLQFEDVSARYIDEPCNYSTGKTLETALKNVIRANAIPGNLLYTSNAIFNLSKTDYANRKLAYDILIVSDLPTEIVSATMQYTVSM